MPLTVRTVAFVLACLAYDGHARRVQMTQEQMQDSSSERRHRSQKVCNDTPSAHAIRATEKSDINSRRGLIMLLLVCLAPAAALQIMVAAAKAPGLGRILALEHIRGTRVGLPPTAAAATSPADNMSDDNVYFSRRSRSERALAALAATPPLLWRLERLTPVSVISRLLTAWLLHWVVKSVQLEMGHRPECVEVEALAQPESRFGLFSPSSTEDKLRLHWIQYPLSSDSNSSSGDVKLRSRRAALVHCNHGFGASGLSWRSCMRQGLGDALGARDVVAHDTPGFGLSERLVGGDGNCFTIAGNANLTLELVRASIGAEQDADSANVHFVGHSMGALTALRASVDWCEKRSDLNSSKSAPTLLVLVAPAIPAPRRSVSFSTHVKRRKKWAPLRAALTWLRRRFVFAVTRLAPIISPLLRLLLRRIVFTIGFWKKGLGMCVGNNFAKADAFHDAVSEYAVPSRLRGWEDGILRFVAGRMREGVTAGSADLVARAAELVKQGALRILIVHGKRDPVLPISNSVALQAVLGPSTIIVGGHDTCWDTGDGAPLIDFEECGHVPHEEEPDRFVQLLRAWAATSPAYNRMMNIVRSAKSVLPEE